LKAGCRDNQAFASIEPFVFTSILCPVDFSDVSVRALQKAIALANADGAHLTLLHVTDPLLDAAARAAGTEDTITEQTQAELQKLLAAVSPEGAKGRMAVSASVGEPAQEILREALESKADLIVMGTQGRGAAGRLLMGSTATRVLEATTTPVLVVPPQRR
jgi:nucleotide-binding universal stress UspA family protein